MEYGRFGGQYVPQELKIRLEEIERKFNELKENSEFVKKYLYYL